LRFASKAYNNAHQPMTFAIIMPWVIKIKVCKTKQILVGALMQAISTQDVVA
jgi:hypothetical protein